MSQMEYKCGSEKIEKRYKFCFIILNKSASVFELSNASKCSTASERLVVVAGFQHLMFVQPKR